MGGKAMDGKRLTRKEVEEYVDEWIVPYRAYINIYMICGSYRRGKDTVGDIDLVIEPKVGSEMMFGMVLQHDFGVKWSLKKKTFKYKDAQVEILVTEPQYWGAMILFATGPGGYNIEMRARAKHLGLKLNQYGVWNGGTCLASRTEDDIYKCLGLRFVSPSARGGLT